MIQLHDFMIYIYIYILRLFRLLSTSSLILTVIWLDPYILSTWYAHPLTARIVFKLLTILHIKALVGIFFFQKMIPIFFPQHFLNKENIWLCIHGNKRYWKFSSYLIITLSNCHFMSAFEVFAVKLFPMWLWWQLMVSGKKEWVGREMMTLRLDISSIYLYWCQCDNSSSCFFLLLWLGLIQFYYEDRNGEL